MDSVALAVADRTQAPALRIATPRWPFALALARRVAPHWLACGLLVAALWGAVAALVVDRQHKAQAHAAVVSGLAAQVLAESMRPQPEGRPQAGPAGAAAHTRHALTDDFGAQVSHLQQDFGAIDGNLNHVALALVDRTGGGVLASLPAGRAWGEPLSGPVRVEMAHQRGGVAQATTSADGARLVAFRQVGDSGLAVLVGVPQAPWYAPGSGHWPAVATALLLSAAAVVVTRRRAAQAVQQRELVAGLQAARDREAQEHRVKSHFLAAAAHELRTPLNAILGFSELIRETTLDESTGRYAGLVHDSGKDLHHLLGTLLDMADVDGGRDAAREPVDLARLVETVAEVYRAEAERKGLGLTVHFELPAGTEARLRSHRGTLTRLVNHVLHDAVWQTRDGGVFVTGGSEQGTFLLRVVDTCGAGRPSHGVPGQALSRELATQLGGTIHIHCEPGQGRQVEIRLPQVELVPEGQ